MVGKCIVARYPDQGGERPLPPALSPANWIDWCLLAWVATGLLTGWRRGLVLAAAGIAVAGCALLAAMHLAPGVASWADARWHVDARLASLAGRVMPLPDGAGSVPYSPAAAELLAAQLTSADPGPYGRAVAGLLAPGGPGSAATTATIGEDVDDQVATRLVGTGAIAATAIAAEAALTLAAVLALGGVARRGVLGLANRALGAVLGATERLVEGAIILAFAAALAAIPAFAGLSGVLHRARWAPPLLSAFAHLGPLAGHWFQAWLAWT